MFDRVTELVTTREGSDERAAQPEMCARCEYSSLELRAALQKGAALLRPAVRMHEQFSVNDTNSVSDLMLVSIL